MSRADRDVTPFLGELAVDAVDKRPERAEPAAATHISGLA
jgi:hypothetical protein